MEAYNLPIKLREWFVQRLLRQKTDEYESATAAAKGKSPTGSTQLGPGSAPGGSPSVKSK